MVVVVLDAVAGQTKSLCLRCDNVNNNNYNDENTISRNSVLVAQRPRSFARALSRPRLTVRPIIANLILLWYNVPLVIQLCIL